MAQTFGCFASSRSSSIQANPHRIRIAGMNADRNAHIGFVLGDGEQLAGIFEIRGRRDHACDAGCAGALQHGREVLSNCLAAEVRVRVKKHVRRMPEFMFAVKTEAPACDADFDRTFTLASSRVDARSALCGNLGTP
jgi:hypothetical protein